MDWLRSPTAAIWLLLLFTIGPSVVAAQAYSSGGKCRCLTGQACFPGADALNALNVSVGGRLIKPRPTAYPCYPSSFDVAACRAAQAGATDGFYRSNQAGSMENWNFEEQGEQRCALEFANITNSVCNQGLVPVYGVQAESVPDVQKTVLFAAQNNLRLYVKNTGHDTLGRSNAPGTFLLWMHKMKTLVLNRAFVPTGCSGQQPKTVLTIGGNPQWFDIYQFVDNQTAGQLILIGGMCPSVGGAGGFIMGGGHGPNSPTYGLGVDHVLEMEVVLADGTVKVVNQCQDPDLFWALKGGGGQTFGVLTKVTSELVPSPTYTKFQLKVTPLPIGRVLNEEQMETLFTALSRQLVEADAARWGAYLEVGPVVGLAASALIPVGMPEANNSIGPILAAFKSVQDQGLVSLKVTIESPKSFWDWRVNHVWPGTDFDVAGIGGRTYQGSRLIPVSALQDPVKLGVALSKASALADAFIGFFTFGRGVREKDPGSLLTAISPPMRATVLHALGLVFWGPDTPASGVAAKAAQLQSSVDVLRQAYPDAGSYFNEAYLEPDFQAASFGLVNYAKLLAIKKRVDPNALFMCTQCVGSEEWDTDGNCRLY